VEQIHAHLRGEIGFHEVGYAPVTAAAEAGHALSEAELAEVHRAFERLGEDYRRAALRGENNGFSNMPPADDRPARGTPQIAALAAPASACSRSTRAGT